jgi:hypothetical protein
MTWTKETRTCSEILDEIAAMVQQAEYFAADVRSDQVERRIPAVVALADAGYAVLSSLSRLKNRVEGFERWYRTKRAEWKIDPLVALFTGLRERRTHEARPPRGGHHIQLNESWSASANTRRNRSDPPLVIDAFGRPKWAILGPDGTPRQIAPPLPPKTVVIVTTYLESIPEAQEGNPLRGSTLPEVCDLYATFLRALLAEANEKFRGKDLPVTSRV